MALAETLCHPFTFQTYSFRSCIHTPQKGFQISSCSCSRSRISQKYRRPMFKNPTSMAVMEEDPRNSGGYSKNKIPHVLTVAGSDSGAGAGIQADLKACGALGVYCSSVITAVTAQNTVGVQGVHVVPEDFVAEQLKSVLSDMQVDVNVVRLCIDGCVGDSSLGWCLKTGCLSYLMMEDCVNYKEVIPVGRNPQVKTGMLPSIGVVKVLCQRLKEFPVQALVVDPVMVSTSGDVLAGPSVLSELRAELLQMADIVTPNLKEASALLGGVPLETVADMCSAAKSIHNLGPKYVLVKGGDLPDSSDAVDIFFDGEQCHELRASRIRTRNTHGTGCTLASCIAAELAKGSLMLPAVQSAKRFVDNALHYSKDIAIGSGPQGPFDHLFKLSNYIHNPCKRRQFKASDLFLYAVTDSRMNGKWGRSITDCVKAAIEGGATIVQLREKEVETREFVTAASACLEICRSHGVPLLINDRVDVALACDADGVHVGQSDMPARVVRTLLGPEKIIGVSCKTPEQAHQAWLDSADYIGCGGVFPTNTKENNLTIGLNGLQNVCLASKLPVVAIGGIGIGNASSVMDIGVPNLKGVAVVSALFDRECVSSETRRLRVVLDTKLTKK